MKTFADLSIKSKLLVGIMLTSGVVLLLATASFVAYDYVTFREKMVSDIDGLAEMIEVNVSTALVFNGQRHGRKAPRGSQGAPRIVRALLFDADGDAFAQYQRDGSYPPTPPTVEQPGSRFEGDSLKLYGAVNFNDNIVGTLYLESDTEEMRARIRNYGTILVILLPSLFLRRAADRHQSTAGHLEAHPRSRRGCKNGFGKRRTTRSAPRSTRRTRSASWWTRSTKCSPKFKPVMPS